MDLGELTDRLLDRDTVRHGLERLAGSLPSRDAVRARTADLPAAARRWLPGPREPAWSDALTARNLAIFGFGLALGAGLAAVLSPRSGPALRRDLIDRLRRLREAGPGGTSVPPARRATRHDGNGTGIRPDLSH